MDIITIVSVMIFIGIVSFPFVLAYRNKRKKEQRLIKELIALANRQFSQVALKEINGNIALGLDGEKSKLFYVQLNGDDVRAKAVHLQEFITTRVKSRYHNDDADNTIESISLVLEPANAHNKSVVLEIFDFSNTTFLDDELHFARKWSERLNTECLKSQTNTTQKLVEDGSSIG